jgi:ABC-type antimicrobial peptide transport system permease subunit
MLSEPYKIIFRRFINRLTESGLLIISVALGVGAFAAGGTLFVNVVNQNNALLNSPSYKEIVVSTREEKETMEVPVEEKLLNQTAVLTSSDLTAAEMIPSISYSYIMNQSRLRMINEDFQTQRANFTPPTSDTTSDTTTDAVSSDVSSDGSTSDMAAPPEDMGTNQIFDEDISTLLEDDSIVLSDEDEVSGYEVTSQFFDAWDLKTEYGSLFSSADYSNTNSLVILGSDFARTLVDDDSQLSSLIGKRLLAMQGYQTIVGILEDTNTDYDYEYFSPYNTDSIEGSTGGLRKMFMNSQLRFSVSDTNELESVSTMLNQWFESEYGEGQVIISNPRVEAEQTVSRNTGISILLLILAVSGLFISSVNIAHILLSRTLRMKKHVGILMALGATRRKINELFSIEAICIIAIGTILGVLIALPINNQMQSALNLGISTNWTIFVSALVSAAIIFAFTLIPIRRFDRIKPADAMRVR